MIRSIVILLLLLPFANSSAQEYKTIKANEDIYLVGKGNRSFSLFYLVDDGVVVIDPMNNEHAGATLEAIRKITDKPILNLFYSHNHWDHIGGGAIFKEEDAKIIAHKEAAVNIAASPEVIKPDSLWIGNKAEFHFGKSILETYYFGKNHGDGMTVFRFPQHNAIFIVDLVVPDRVLYSYLPDAQPKEWRLHLDSISELDFDAIYMSHERAIGDRRDLQLMKDYFDDLYAAVENEMNAGTPFFDIPEKVELPKYTHLKKYDEWLHMNVWRILMEKSIGQ